MIKIFINSADLDKKAREVKKACERAINTAAGRICEDAKSSAPVKTGRLRDSIKVEKADNRMSVGSSLSYAFFVEFGTERSEPSPYLQPAAVSGTMQLRDCLEEEFSGI